MQSKSIFVLLFVNLVTIPTATSKKIKPRTETHTPIMILGSSSDFELFPSPAFMVGTTVVGREEHIVDVSGVDVGSGSVSYK